MLMIQFTLPENCRDRVTWIWDYNGEDFIIDWEDEVHILIIWFAIGIAIVSRV